jgi:putative holliday junction resolvase
MKILALDIGDRWVGSAISDPLGMLARPYKTVKANELNDFLTSTLSTESIETIVVGYPKTMRGTESDQTKKIVEQVEQLKKQFPAISWQLWDERLTSKMASGIKKEKTKEDKLKGHSVAAALILESYLSYLHIQKSNNNF